MDSGTRERAGGRLRWLSGSLALRLVVLVTVPAAVGIAHAVHVLDEGRNVHAESREAAEGMELFDDLAAVYGSATAEQADTIGLCAAMQGGRDEASLATIVGYDVMPYLYQARAALDADLASFVADHPTVQLSDGRTASAALLDLSQTVAVQRQELDGGCAGSDAIDSALRSVVTVMDDVRAVTADPEETLEAGTAAHVVLERMSLLIDTLAALSDETSATIAAIVAPERGLPAMMRTAGVAEYTTSLYVTALAGAPDRLPAWTALQDAAATTVFADAQQGFIGELTGDPTVAGPPTVEGSDARIRSRGHLLIAAVDRLTAFVDYARSEFATAHTQVSSLAAEADDEWTRTMVVAAAATALLIAFLVSTIVSSVVPLRRLAARGRRFVHGESAPPLAPAGPNVVREVTETFNFLTSTVASFEHELTRAARGEEPDAAVLDAMPGTLGASLRTSVSRLATLSQQLLHSEALSSSIVETAADAIWTLDDHDHIRSANHAAIRLLGLPSARQLGAHLPTLLGGRSSCADLDGEIDLARGNGVVTHLFVSRRTVPAEPHPVTTVFARDISDQKRFEQRLAFQARYDVLTGLPNRLAAFEHLDAALSHGTAASGQLAVLFIDLDGFKAVNDSRGHSSGDRLLQVVARRLRTGLRNSEFVARLGGDEFLVVMEHASLEAATSLAQRTLQTVARPFASDEDRFVISASIGVALGTPGQVDSIELVRQADIAVYHAKEAGRARMAIFDDTLQAAIEANAEIELALHSAIAHDELVLHYQPVLDLHDDRPWGAEALLRWNRPGHGTVQPDRFIPVAERSSLILDFGRWVLHEACRKLAVWQRQPARSGLHLAVNISGRHLAEGDLVADVEAALAATGADPSALEIELTETHLLDDLNRTNEVLDELRAKGISIAVDDFGTGYSSMTYLRQLHINTLKMDRTFISRVEQSGYDRTIVDVILQLGQTLHLAVVAEGIETTGQLDILRLQGCDRAQGYLFARPMPAEHFDQWLGDVWTNHPAFAELIALIEPPQ